MRNKSQPKKSVGERKNKVLLYKRRWQSLNPREKLLRTKSLEVLNQARKSKKSVSKIAKENAISLRTVKSHTNGFRKENGRLVPKKFDRISRSMLINENGKETSIEINDSRTASTIGKYHASIKTFLNTGNTKPLSRFSKKKIRDSDGNIHSLETDPKKIIQINERIEPEPDRPEVYSI